MEEMMRNKTVNTLDKMVTFYKGFQFPLKPISQQVLRTKFLEENMKSEILNKWVNEEVEFQSLCPIFFNLLNRGDNWDNIWQSLNESLKNIKDNQFKKKLYFNKKLLFYIYF